MKESLLCSYLLFLRERSSAYSLFLSLITLLADRASESWRPWTSTGLRDRFSGFRGHLVSVVTALHGIYSLGFNKTLLFQDAHIFLPVEEHALTGF